MSNFDKQAILEQVNQLTFSRLQSLGIHETELNGLAEFIFSYNEIAVNLLGDEPGIQLPDATDVIPINEQNALQTSTLFAEGIIFTLLRIQEYKIPGELVNPLAQQVAMPVYEQAKQIVAATHGQEHTPEFQISPEQQAEYISQAAESALLYYINEYEKENGPIHQNEDAEEQGQPIEPAQPQPTVPQATEFEPEPNNEPPTASQLPTLPPQPDASQGAAANHEKLAAVALLLTTFSAQHRAKILNRFAPEEKELIAFYSYPQHIEQNLDPEQVALHLRKLKTHFSKREKPAQTPFAKRMTTLTSLISAEKLLSCVKDERPVVARYLAVCAQNGQEMPDREIAEQETAETDPAAMPFLSPRLEEILYQYLTRRLSPELKQALHSEG